MSEYIIWESDKTETTDNLGVKHSVSHFEKREEIVRCRDCKYFLCLWIDGYVCKRNGEKFMPWIDPDGFCKWAERREP